MFFLKKVLLSISLVFTLHAQTVETIKLPSSKIDLTQKEKKYLKSIDSIPTCYDTLCPPYTMIKEGKALGVSFDYLKRVEKKIDKKFKLIYTNSAAKQYTMAYNKKCIVIPLTQTSPQVAPFIIPTIPAGKDNLVLVTKINEPYIFNIKKLKDKKLV